MSETTTYEYKVKDHLGKLQSGKVQGSSDTAVAEKLREMGYTPLDIREQASGGMRRELKIGLPKRVKIKDVAIFARQFATMIGAGLSMTRSLTILSEQTENEALRKIVRTVKAEVEGGKSLSEALSAHQKVFPPLMVNMTRAGEVGGFLDTTMLQIAANYESEVRLKGKVKSAMTYPVVVFIMALLMCSAMLLFIVPVFENMFKNLGGQLPLPTQILVYLSTGLRFGFPFILAGTIVGIWAWRKYGHTLPVRERLDPIKLKMPVFGPLVQKIALARFARNFSTLLSSGVPILQCLDIVADTTGSTVIAKALREVQDSVRAGETISGPLTRHAVFPPMIVQMMSVGEDTGAMDKMLQKIAEFYDQEVEATTEALTALIEPLMIAVLGLVVGSMIIALYMPIFKVFDLIG